MTNIQGRKGGLHRKSGGTPLTGILPCWQNVDRKLHENERNWTEKGRVSPVPPCIRRCPLPLNCIDTNGSKGVSGTRNPSPLHPLLGPTYFILVNETFRPKFKGWCPQPPPPRLGNPCSYTNKSKYLASHHSTIVVDLRGGARGTTPGGPNPFNFMQFFGKFWQNLVMPPTHPSEELAPPPR